MQRYLELKPVVRDFMHWLVLSKNKVTHLYPTRDTALCKFDATNHCCFLLALNLIESLLL